MHADERPFEIKLTCEEDDGDDDGQSTSSVRTSHALPRAAEPSMAGRPRPPMVPSLHVDTNNGAVNRCATCITLTPTLSLTL